ncbi:MAG: hypothetical protein H0W18_17875 [Acidobacteria bacterium]|nr:hypothetical protein [Acidobacteriota bacterium]
MKKQLTAIGMAVAFGVGGVGYAQSSGMDKGQMDKGMKKDGAVTMSGCLTAGKNSGHYMLTNAMMMGSMMGKDKMSKDKMEPGMSGHMMSYDLVGGGDLKAHLGHKMEVTGTMSKSDMDKMHKMGSMSQMEKDKMEKEKMDKGMMAEAMKLNVKSVKMVSESCS